METTKEGRPPLPGASKRCFLPPCPVGGTSLECYVPEAVITAIIDSMAGDQDRAEAPRRAQITNAEQRLSPVRSRMDQAYEDKLDGRLDQQIWARKMRAWRDHEI